jgi:nucleoid DNA-binding protein
MNIESLSRELLKTGLVASRNHARNIINATFDIISDMVADGHRVQIRDFGTLYAAECAPRVGRNPKTGDSLTIPAKRRLRITPAKAIKGKINERA